jgi:hypothetical protein
MVHCGFIIDEEEFECLSHGSWTVLFYQLSKLYIEANINDKILNRLKIKNKHEKIECSIVYS